MTARKTTFVCSLVIFTVAGIVGGDFLVRRHIESVRAMAATAPPAEPQVGLNGIFGARQAANTDFPFKGGLPHNLLNAPIDDPDLRLFPFVPKSGEVALLNEVPADATKTEVAAPRAPAVPEQPVKPPQQISPPSEASPIGEAGPDAAADVRKIIEQEFPSAPSEELEVWRDSLKSLSPAVVRDILQLRRKFSSQPAPQPSPPAVPRARASEPKSAALDAANASEPRTPLVSSSAGMSPSLGAVSGGGDRLPIVISPLQPPSVPLHPPPASPHPSPEALDRLQSTISALNTACQVIVNNMANASTTGFKRSRVIFEDADYQRIRFAGTLDLQNRPTATGLAIGSGIRVQCTQIDQSPGILLDTNPRLDLAIVGDGFFKVQDEQHSLYTRAGNFSLNANGDIVLGSANRGRLLEPNINIPQDATDVIVSPEGIVSVLQANSTSTTQAGTIQITKFVNPGGLVPAGENLLEDLGGAGTPLTASPGQQGLGVLRQRFLESSNVKLQDELAELKRLSAQLQALRAAAEILSGSR